MLVALKAKIAPTDFATKLDLRKINTSTWRSLQVDNLLTHGSTNGKHLQQSEEVEPSRSYSTQPPFRLP